jgi:integrase/recombinase XerD
VSKWVIKVSNPKGKNRYGVERTVPIPTPARLYVMDYLQQRDEFLRQHNLSECEQLIPRANAKGEAHYYSSNHFRKLKGEVQRLSGIDFRLKDFRSTYAQLLKDKGLAIEKVSKVLGHSSTETTERFYARIKDVSIFDEINDLWLDKPDVKKGQISVLAR